LALTSDCQRIRRNAPIVQNEAFPSLEHPRGYVHAVEKIIVYERLHFDDSNKLPILILVNGLACLADRVALCMGFVSVACGKDVERQFRRGSGACGACTSSENSSETVKSGMGGTLKCR